MKIYIAPNGVGTIHGPFTMEQRDVIATLPDVNWQYGDTPRFRVSLANVVHLRQLGEDVEWNGDLIDIDLMLAQQAAGHRQPTDADTSYPFRTTPRPGQMKAFAFARHLKQYALLCDPGTGKTKMTFDIAAAKFEADEIDCLLVIAPNGVHRQWIEEQMPVHLPDIAHRAAFFGQGKRALASVTAPWPEGLRILTVNTEALSYRTGAFKAAQEFIASGRCMIAVDESTRIKNFRGERSKTGAARAKNVIELGTLCVVRSILTGTVVTKNLMDLFGQFYFLSSDIIGFRNFYRFRDRYAVVVPAYPRAPVGVVKIERHINVVELLRKIAPFSIRVQKTGLPEKTFERRPIELTPEQRKHYNELVHRFATEVEGTRLTAVNAAARTIRLQQVLSGFIADPADPTRYILLPQRRTAALVDYIDTIGDRQLVVWVRFHEDADIVQAALEAEGITNVVCDGRDNSAERARRKRAFIAGEYQVIICNYDAMGTGTDGLQVTGLAYLYSHTFDAEKRWQAEDRTHRDGLQAEDCHYVEAHVPNTVDDLFLTNNADKRTLAQRVEAFIANPSLQEV